MSWISSALRRWAKRSCPRQELEAQLGITKLERRRVLNADAVVSELVVDAGQDADDGLADEFEVEIADQRIEVSRNGELVESVSADRVSSIRLVGSTDDDQFRINFLDDTTSVDVTVDGQGGENSLQLDSLERVQELIYLLEDLDAGRIEINNASSNLEVSFDNLSSVTQNAIAESQRFIEAADDSVLSVGGQTNPWDNAATNQLVLSSDDVNSNATLSYQESISIYFANPTSSLQIESSADGEGPNRLFIDGFAGSFGDRVTFGGDFDSIDIVGELHLVNGDLFVEGDSISVDATVWLDSGNAEFVASQNIEITESGAIRSPGGSVSLDSDSLTRVQGTIDVSAATTGALGGRIEVLGASVDLAGSSSLIADGYSGGGTILIGGDYQGRNTSIRNARTTFFDEQAVVRANALQLGDGGRVIVWSDEKTQFSGNIYAEGGREGGDGGFVEVSGKHLEYEGWVSVIADQGNAGTIFIDPTNIIIGTGTSDSATTYYTPAMIVSMLEAGNVSLQADNDITVAEGFTVTTGSNSLTFTAGRSIDLQADFTLLGDFIATANSSAGDAMNRGLGAATFSMQTEVDVNVSANNSNITITMANGFATVDNFAGDVTLEDLNTGTGALTVNVDAETDGTDILQQSAGGDIVAGTVTLSLSNALNATGTIGTSSAAFRIEQMTNLNVSSVGADVFISDPDLDLSGVTLAAISTTNSFSFESAGAITVTSVTAGGNVEISTTAGLVQVSDAAITGVNVEVVSGNGNVVLGDDAIDASGGVQVTATTGSITQSSSGTPANISAGGTVVLSSATGIGASGSALDLEATSVAARTTTSGGIYLDEVNGLIVSSGTVGGGTATVTGLSTASNGDIEVTSGSATLQVGQAITAGAGTVTLGASALDIDANVTGGSLDFDATGSLGVAAGARLVGGGNATAITLDAATIQLGTGASNSETVRNTGTGTISLTSTGGDVSLGSYALRVASGSLTIDADTDDIVVLDAGGTRQINASSDVTLTAAAIGSSTNELHLINATALVVADTGAGSMHLEEVGSNSIASTSITVGGSTFGSIGIDYNNSDQVTIANGHALTLVDLDAADRAFDYTASAGSISVNQVLTGSSALSLTATTGAITEAVASTAINITSTGQLALLASTGVGSSGSALDLSAGQVAARTNTSGIFLAGNAGMTIASANGLDGLEATTSGDVDVRLSGGNLVVNQSITTASGNVTLEAADISVNDDVSGTNLDIDATGEVSVASGIQLQAGGDGTSIEIDAATSISLGAGSIGAYTLENTGTGTVALGANTASEVSLSHYSIGTATGAVTIDAGTDDILVLDSGGTQQISAAASLTLTGGAIGSASNELHMENVTSLTLNDTAAGSIHLEEIGSNSITSTTISVGNTAFGTIAIDYANSDQVDIANSHAITLVDHDEADREFHYTATLGSLSVDQIINGNSATSLTASAGTVQDANGGSVNVSSSGTLALTASAGVGSSGDAFDVAVGQVAATSTTGGIFLAGNADFIVGSAGGLIGLTTTTSGDVSVQVAGANLAIQQAIDSAGDVVATAADLNVSNNLSGANIDLDATGSVTIDSGSVVTAGGTGTTLEIDAATSITLQSGSAGAETIQNTSTGTISLGTNNASQISLDRFAIGIESGDLILDAGTANVNVVEASGNAEITAGAAVHVEAAVVGSSSNDLEIDGATSYVVTDTGAGDIFLAELTASTVVATSITVSAAGNGSISIDYHDADSVQIDDNHVITSVVQSNSNRNFAYNATSGNISIGSIDAGTADVVIEASSGSLSDQSSDTVADIVTTGTATLSASMSIGSIGDSFDVNVGVLAAEAGGDLSIAATGALRVGSGANLIDGVSVGAGGNVELTAVTLFSVDAGQAVVGGGDGTQLSISADEMTLNSGTAGGESVRNTGTGTTTLTSSGNDIRLDHFSVGGGSGLITIDAGTQRILASQATATGEINTAGGLSLAASQIGSATNSVEISGATELNLIDQGAGEISIAEVGGNSILSTTITVGNVGFGTIDIDYSDADLVDIDDNHSLNSVVHQNSNRSFQYAASAGDLSIGDGAITAGAGNVTLIASAGQISEAVSNTTSDISTTGILTLDAQSGIGSTGAGAIDTDVVAIAARTVSGGVFVNELDALQIGSSGLLTGVSATNATISIFAGGDLVVDELVDSGNGLIDLDGSDIDINANVEGGDIDIDAAGSFGLAVSAELIAGGDGTTLAIDASSLTIRDGTSGNETIQNTGTGSVVLTSSTGDILLGSHSVATGTGSIVIDSAGQIDEDSDSNDVNVSTGGSLTLNAVGAIGAPDLSGSGPLDISASTLNAQATAAGGIYLKTSGGITITDVDTVNGEVQIQSGGTITVQDLVASGDVTLDSTVNVILEDNSISAGTSNVTLVAAGQISESTVNSTIKVVTTGTVTLSGSLGVGASGTNGEIDLQAGSLVASSTTGDIYIADIDGLVIGSGGFGISTSGGLVSVRSDAGSIQVVQTISTGSGNITLEATSLDIDSSITGASIDLDTVGLFDVANGSLITAGGSGTTLTIDADSAVIGNGSAPAHALENLGTGTISVTTSSGSVSLGNYAIESSTGNIQIDSATAIIESSAGDTTSITSAGTLSLTADGAIGASGGAGIAGTAPLDIAVADLTVIESTGSGVFIKDAGGLTVSSINAASGPVELLSTGTIQLTSLGTSGSVTIVSTTGDVVLADSAINAGAADVSLTATLGAINEAADNSNVNVSTTGTLALSAGAGVGVSSAIDTDVSVLASQVNTGGLNVLQSSGLTIGTASGLSGVTVSSGNTTIQSAGALVVDTAIQANNSDIDIDATDITLNANVDGDSIDLAGTGAVSVSSGIQITGGGAGTGIAVSGSSISLAAGTASGSEAIRNTGSGSISLSADGNIQLTDHALATGTGTISIDSTTGSISETLANTVNKITTSGLINFMAAGSIGSSATDGSIDIDAGSVSVQSSGGVYLNELNDLAVGNGVTGIETGGGDLVLTLGGNLQTTQLIDAGSGTVTINGDDFDLDAGMRGGNITLTASGSLDLATGQQVIGGGSSTLVNIQAQTISFNGGSSGNESVRNTGTGSVAVTVTTGNFLISDAAIGVDDGDISITASSGSIAESVPGSAVGIRTIGTLTLIASTGIGTSAADGEIDTQVGTLAASTTTGGIFIVEADDLIIGNGFGIAGVTSGSLGNVEIRTGGVSGGNLQVTQAIDAGAGSLVLDVSDLNAQASLLGQGVDVDATGSVVVDDGQSIESLGTNTSLTIDAASIQLGMGSSGAETVRNQTGGVLTLASTTGDLTLAEHAISGGTGLLTLDAGTNSIVVTQATGTAELATSGDLAIEAAEVGSSTNQLDITGATSLTLTDTGAGNFYLNELTASNIASTTVTVGDNGFGTITVNYFDGDDLNVGGDHLISLSQATNGRAFDYTAGSGNVRIADNGIDAGSANVRITANNGSISELNNNTNVNVSTTGTLTLVASAGVGSSGQSLDTNVGTIAIGSTAGGAFVNQAGGLVVGMGNGIAGINVVDGIDLSSSGAIVVDQTVSSSNGDVSVAASSLTANATISGQNITIGTTSTLTLATGSQLLGGGDSTSVQINAGSTSIAGGSLNNETIRNTGTGSVNLVVTSDLNLEEHAISSGTGGLSIDAGVNAVLASNASGVSELRSTGAITIDAATIGSATNRLDVAEATSLILRDSGSGDVYLAEVDANSITDVSVTIESGGSGSIDIDFFNTDVVDIAAGQVVNRVDQSGFNRSFSYSTTNGDILLANAGIDTGSAGITLTTNAGAILESTASTTAKLTSQGLVTLNATNGIGSSASDASLDTDIASLSAETSTGGIFINEANDLTIGAPSGISATTSGDISLVAGGNVIVDETVEANAGSLVLSAAGFTLNADARGETGFDLDATGTVTINSGNQLVAGASASALTIDAGQLSVGAGSTGAGSIQSLGNAEITLVITGSVTLDEYAIHAVNGGVSIDAATGGIIVNQATGTPEITSNGALTLRASSIGTAVANLDVDGVTSLTLVDTGAGGIHINELNSASIGSVAIDVAASGYGTIDIGFSNTDVIDIDDNHSITSADLDEQDRSLSYTAGSGDLVLGDAAVQTANADVYLEATAGSILDLATGNASVTSLGTLTLNSQGDIGVSGTNSLDIAVTSLAASSVGGVIAIRDADGLRIGSGSNSVSGLTASGDVSVESNSALTVDASVSSTSGTVSLQVSSADLNANVSGTGIDIDATGLVDLAGGSQINASGTGIAIDADQIQINSGTTSAASLVNASASALAMNATTSMSLGEFAITSGAGTITLASPTINVIQASGNAEVTSTGALEVISGTIGSSTSRLEVDGATSLALTDSGAGGIYLGELTAATIAELDVTVSGTGFGELDIAYSNADAVQIADSHQINAVSHQTANRDFTYTATSGDVVLGSLSTGTANLTIEATSGQIDRLMSVIPNASASQLTLVASGSIGGGSGGAIQTAVDTFAARTTAGGLIAINETDQLEVTTGDSGIVGLTTSSNGSISVSSGGDLRVAETINSGSGAILISSGQVDVNADVSGGDVQITSTANVDIADGFQVIAGGAGTTLQIDAVSIGIGSGSAGTESIRNTGSGLIALSTTGGDLTIEEHGIGGGTGDVTINTGTNAIVVAQPTGVTEVSVQGGLTLVAQSIGSATNELDIEGAISLVIESDGLGDFHLQETTGSTITDVTLTVQSSAAGTINLDFSNADQIAIGANHSINQVDLSVRNGDFTYQATSGDVQVDAVDVGSGAVVIEASSGSIVESGSDTAAEFTTSGSLSLSASGSVGTSSDRIETDVTTLSATGNGGIYVNEADDLIIGVTPDGQAGLTTSGGTLELATSGTLQVDEAISTNGGGILLSAATLDLNQSIAGSSITLQSTNNLTIDSGTTVSAGGDSTTLRIEAPDINIGQGATGNATLNNSGTGAIEIVSTGSVVLADDSVEAESGDISIVASSGTINEAVNNDNANVRSQGQLNLTSAGDIGSNAASGALDVAVQSLTATVTGTGAVFVSDVDDLVVDGVSTVDGDIDIQAANSLQVDNAITAGTSGNIDLAASTVALNQDGDLSALGGTVSLDASTGGGLTFNDNAVITTGSGSVSGQLFNASNPFAASSSVGSALSDSNRIATINVALTDSFGTNISVEVDWDEGDQINPVPTVPPEDLRAQVVQTNVAVASVGTDVRHEYEDAPDPSNPSADINIGLSIRELAGGTIQLFAGGASLLTTSQLGSQVLTIEVSAAIFPIFITVPEEESSEPVIADAIGSSFDRDVQRVFVNEAAQELNNSIGTTDNSHQRYYVLRIVSFGEEGEVRLTQDDQEYRLQSMVDKDSEAGFELSQLPELFKKLPDDRYRIYLIEGQTERLVLDFIIRDGQPIEAKADEVESTASVPSADPPEPSMDPEQIDDDEIASKKAIKRNKDQTSEELTEPDQRTAMEQLGSVSMISAGGVVLTAQMMNQTNQARRRGPGPACNTMPKQRNSWH